MKFGVIQLMNPEKISFMWLSDTGEFKANIFLGVGKEQN